MGGWSAYLGPKGQGFEQAPPLPIYRPIQIYFTAGKLQMNTEASMNSNN